MFWFFSSDIDRPQSSADDFERRGALPWEKPFESVSFGDVDVGDEPTDEASVTEAPLERRPVDDVSESLSEARDEADDIDETLRILWAVATSTALIVCTLVVERKTGAEICIDL
jgi:hypothetical protein